MFSIRRAKLSDLSSIVECNIRMASESEEKNLDRNILTEGVREALTDEGKALYFVAVANDSVVGTMMITYEWSDWRNGQIWWIQSVYVLPEWRRQGVFSAMYQHVYQLAQAKKVKGLRLYMKHNNTTAQKVYEQVGMRKSHYVVFERIPL